jgi:hypothetical protein
MGLGATSAFIAVLYLGMGACTGEGLRAEYIGTVLPGARIRIEAIYDGNDSIYLFGGYGEISGAVSDILRFDISTERIAKVGEARYDLIDGHVQMDSNGNFLYFGSGFDGKKVLRFNPLLDTTEEVGQLPYHVTYGTSVSTSGTAYIFGGIVNQGGILSFNMETFRSEEVGSLPINYSSLASVQFGNKAYIFGSGGDTMELKSVLSVNLDTLQTETGPKDFPYIYDSRTNVVFDGTMAYIVGGYMENITGIPPNSLLSFDPATYQWKHEKVENLMINGDDHWLRAGPSCVFIEKLNRIYMFGGGESKSDEYYYSYYRKAIGYIDLSPLTITTTVPITSTTPVPDFDCTHERDGN